MDTRAGWPEGPAYSRAESSAHARLAEQIKQVFGDEDVWDREEKIHSDVVSSHYLLTVWNYLCTGFQNSNDILKCLNFNLDYQIIRQQI